MAFIVNEEGDKIENGPRIDYSLNVFGPFDTEEDAIKWAESEAKKRWESPVGEASKIAEAGKHYYSNRSEWPGRIPLPLHTMYPGGPDEDDVYFWFDDCYFFVRELTSPNAA